MRPDAFADLRIPAHKESSGRQFLPYLSHIDDETISTQDKNLIAFIRLHGIETDSLTNNEIETLFHRRNQLLISAVNPNTALHYLTIKRKQTLHRPNAISTDNPLLRYLIDTHQRQVFKDSYNIDHYLALMLIPQINRKLRFLDFLLELLRGADPRKRATNTREKLATLHRYAKNICNILQDHDARILGRKERDNGSPSISEPLSVLSYLYNHTDVHRPFPDPGTPLNRIIPLERLSFPGDFPFSGIMKTGNHFATALSIKDFPAAIRVGCLNPLADLDAEYIVSLSYCHRRQSDSTSAIARQSRLFNMSQDTGFTQALELINALDEVQANETSFGETSLHFLHFAQTMDQLKIQDEEIRRVLDNAGLIPVDDNAIIDAKFLATLPGNLRYRSRVYTGLSSRNVSALMSWHTVPVGREGNHWTDRPLAWFSTAANTPYRLNLHMGDLGNTTITGQSGSGKTVLLLYLAACCLNAGARVALVDKNHGAEPFVRAAGGRYYEVEPGKPTGFNPFALEPTPTNLAFVNDLVLSLLESKTGPLPPEQSQTLAAAVQAVYGLADQNKHRLATVVQFLSRQTQSELFHALAPWHTDGRHAWLFDNADRLTTGSKPLTAFDLTHILDDPRLCGLALRWILHEVEGLLDGKPVAIMIDEGWRALDDARFAAHIKDFAKTIRKRNGILLFGSNNPADLTRTEAGIELITQGSTYIFTANPAGEPEHYDHYKVNDQQIERILALDKPDHEFILIHHETRHTARIRFDLSDHPDLIKLLSGETATVRIMQDLITQHGAAPADWVPHFTPGLSELWQQQ